MKSATLAALFAMSQFIPSALRAQTWDWVNTFGSPDYDFAIEMGIDPSDGAVLLTGGVRDSATVCGSLQPSTGAQNMFLTKYAASGSCLWTVHENSGSYSRGDALAIDDAGNVYVCGLMTDTFRVGGTTLLTHGFSDIFLVKYSASGQLLWAKNFGGAASDIGYDLQYHNGSLYMVGQSGDTADFGTKQLISGFRDFFLARFDTAGNALQVKSFGGNSDDRAYRVRFDPQGNIWLTGFFSDTVQLGSQQLISAGGKDVFLLELDNSWNPVLAFSWGGPGLDEPLDLARNPLTGDWLVTFFYFKACTISGVDLDTSQSINTALACFSPAGSYRWHKDVATPAATHSGFVDALPNGEIWYAIHFKDTGTFDTLSLTSADGMILFTRLDTDGNLLYHTTWDFPGMERVWGVRHTLGRVHLFGVFSGQLNLDGPHQSTGSWDAWVARMDPGFTGLDAGQQATKPALYPVPASDRLYLRLPEGYEGKTWEILSLNGQRLGRGTLTGHTAVIPVEQLPPGMYLLKCGTFLGKWVK